MWVPLGEPSFAAKLHLLSATIEQRFGRMQGVGPKQADEGLLGSR